MAKDENSDMQTYFIQDADTLRVKIGRSRNPARRLKDLQTANGSKLVLKGVLGVDIEKELHEQFASTRVGHSEWFDFSDELNTLCVERFGKKGRLADTVVTPQTIHPDAVLLPGDVCFATFSWGDESAAEDYDDLRDLLLRRYGLSCDEHEGTTDDELKYTECDCHYEGCDVCAVVRAAELLGELAPAAVGFSPQTSEIFVQLKADYVFGIDERDSAYSFVLTLDEICDSPVVWLAVGNSKTIEFIPPLVVYGSAEAVLTTGILMGVYAIPDCPSRAACLAPAGENEC